MSDISREDVVGLGGVIEELNDTLRQRDERYRKIFIGLGIVTFLSIVFGVGASWAAIRANDAANAAETAVSVAEADLLERRIDACNRDNEMRRATRLMATTSSIGWQAFLEIAVRGETPDAETQANIDEFNRRVVLPFVELADVDGEFAPRDCSVAAIQLGG